MSTTQTFTGTLVVICCTACGSHFGIEKRFEEARRDDGKTFYCPAGHSLSWNGDRVQLEKRLAYAELLAQRARDDAAFQRSEKERAQRQTSAARGRVTRIKNRVMAGVCPCCNRSFKQLRDHMAEKHPEYVQEQSA